MRQRYAILVSGLPLVAWGLLVFASMIRGGFSPVMGLAGVLFALAWGAFAPRRIVPPLLLSLGAIGLFVVGASDPTTGPACPRFGPCGPEWEPWTDAAITAGLAVLAALGAFMGWFGRTAWRARRPPAKS